MEVAATGKSVEEVAEKVRALISQQRAYTNGWCTGYD